MTHNRSTTSKRTKRSRVWAVVTVALGPIAIGASPASAQVSDFQFADPLITVLPTENFPTNIGAADLDGDGNIDVVITGRDAEGVFYVMLGNGDGTFQSPQTLLIEAHSDWVDIADLNGDGTLDLAIAVRARKGGVAVFFGNGDGTFPETFDFYHTGRTTWGVIARDLDGDEDIDLASANNSSGSVVVLINDGDGSFTIGQKQRVSRFTTASAAPSQFGAEDFDGDGDIDLAVSIFSAGRIGILLNNGDGTFEPEASYGPQDGNTHLVVADMDNDDHVDTLTALITDDDGLIVPRLGFLPGNGDGTFGTRELFDTSAGGFPFFPAVGDLDHDGDLDVAIGTGLAGRIWVMENTLSGDPQFLFPVQLATASFFRHVALVDVDNDCDLDLLAVESPSDSFYVFLNETPQEDGCSPPAPGAPPERAPADRSPHTGMAPTETPTALELVSDRNGDGVVTSIDVAIFLAEWGADE